MNDPNGPEAREQVTISIEGDEDPSIRPWSGPSTLKADSPAEAEHHHVLVVNDEDLTVRPWRRAAVLELTPAPAETR